MSAILPAPSPARLPVAVLGAGLTGLAAAWHLRRAGIPVIVFESSGRCGGAVETRRDGDWLHEAGPNSLLEDNGEGDAAIEALGLGGRRLLAAGAARHRYVVKEGRLQAMPASPRDFLRTGLFSWRAKFGLAAEVLRPRRRAESDETAADFTVRRLGREFLDYAVDPLVGGIYAGDPAKLSVRHAFPRLFALERDHGSLLRGAIRRRSAATGPRGRIFSFPEGLEELIRTLAEPLAVSLQLRTRVLALRREERGWRVANERGGVTRWEAFSSVISALPAGALARISLEGCPHPDILSVLSEIEHPPLASVFTGYRREDIAHPLDGFGMLVPGCEGRGILGTLFSSTLFPGRAPDGAVALTSFVGGARQPALAGRDDRDLARLVHGELASLLGAGAEPIFVRIVRHARSIPQYNVGYARYREACARAESAAPGLHIGGNARDGVSLPACLASGARLAQAAAGDQPA